VTECVYRGQVILSSLFLTCFALPSSAELNERTTITFSQLNQA